MKKKPFIIFLSITALIVLIRGYYWYRGYTWEKCYQENWLPHLGDTTRFHVMHDDTSGETIYSTHPKEDELKFGFTMVIPPKGNYGCFCFAEPSLNMLDETVVNEDGETVNLTESMSNDTYLCQMTASVDKSGTISEYQFGILESTKEGNWLPVAELDLNADGSLRNESMLSDDEKKIYQTMLPTMQHCITKTNSLFQF